MYQYAQDTVDVSSLRAARIKFSITIGASSPFSKAVIAFRVHHSLFVDRRKISSSRPNILPPFEEHGFDPLFNEAQSGEKSCGPRTNNDCSSGAVVYVLQL